MRLYVDDLRSLPPDYDTLARTYAEALALLERGDVEVVSLDHDLGGARTGYDLACALERFAAQGRPVPTIHTHSANPVGAQRIRAAAASVARLVDGRRA